MARTTSLSSCVAFGTKSSTGQVYAEPAIVNQPDPFLPRCPIISRYNVIPAGYEKRLHAESSHESVGGHAAAQMRCLLRRRGLRKTKSIDGAPENPQRGGKSRLRPALIRHIVAGRTHPEDAVSDTQKFIEGMTICPFLRHG